MFHSRVIGTKSRNLDTFFTSPEVTRYLLGKNAGDCRIAVMEGVMGYYDGVGGTTSKASAYDLASATDTPVIFIVNSKGMSVSLAAYIKGFLEYKKDSRIRGVILNQMSPMLYPRMKTLLEKELGMKVLGYVPKAEDCVIESRHLGLVLPDEIPRLQENLKKLAGILEETLDMEGILALADSAPELETNLPDGERKEYIWKACGEDETYKRPLRIGVAKDEAFCFFYEDNFQLLKKMGAELIFFSPMRDSRLPKELDGLLLYGGYPELNGAALGAVPAHEFHYFDSENCGEDFLAQKPESNRSWNCIHGTENLLAGFPHLYYYGNPKVPEAFLKQCAAYRTRMRQAAEADGCRRKS